MCVRRDAAYVRWRYRGAPHKQYEILEARRGGTLLGFIVTRQVDHRGLRLGWIVDLFAACDDRSTKDALLATAMKRFSKDRVARAQAFCTNARLAVDLRRHGFFKGASPAHLCVRPRNISGDPVSRVDDWHIVYGDSDSDR